jgi:hypothetical protein
MRRVPRPLVYVHGEDVDVDVPGKVMLRASFLSEGLFDERAGGDPEEEDLYEIEVAHPGNALLSPIVFNRLMPASGRQVRPPAGWGDWDDGDEELSLRGDPLPVERFLLALAWDLSNAHPSNWAEICGRARLWDSWMIEDALMHAPSHWTPEPLRPDDD